MTHATYDTATDLPDYDMNDVELGSKCLGYIGYALSTLASAAMAWACSSVIIGVIVAIISGIVLYILSEIAHIMWAAKAPTSYMNSAGAVGKAAGSVAAKFSGFFAKK